MKKEVKVLGLSYAQSQTGSYVVVLSEKRGNRKIPIVIKPSDAQQIALKIEGVKSPRPLTHDLFKSVTDAFGIDVQEVYIYEILEGIFYTKLISSNGIDDIEIECTAGDGIALAIVYGCPLFASDEVLKKSGVIISDDGESIVDDEEDLEDEFEMQEIRPKKSVVTVENLEKMLEKALEDEEYEIAAELRDRIAKMKGNA